MDTKKNNSVITGRSNNIGTYIYKKFGGAEKGAWSLVSNFEYIPHSSINRETDRLIMTIEFRGLSLNSSYAYFRFHRRSREPIVTGDSLTVVYRKYAFYIILPLTPMGKSVGLSIVDFNHGQLLHVKMENTKNLWP